MLSDRLLASTTDQVQARSHMGHLPARTHTGRLPRLHTGHLLARTHMDHGPAPLEAPRRRLAM